MQHPMVKWEAASTTKGKAKKKTIRKLRKQTTGQTTNSSKKHVGEVCVKPNGNTSIIP